MKKILLLSIIFLIPLYSVFSEPRFILGGLASGFSNYTYEGYSEKITDTTKPNTEEKNTSYILSSSSKLALLLGFNVDEKVDIYISTGIGSLSNFNLISKDKKVSLSKLFLSQDINARYNFSTLEWLGFYLVGGAGLDIFLLSLMEERDSDSYVATSSSYPLDAYLLFGGGISFLFGTNHNHRISFGPKIKWYITEIFGIEKKSTRATFTSNTIKRTAIFEADDDEVQGYLEVIYSYTF